MERGIVAGGCNVPFGEPWPSNIPHFSTVNFGQEAKPFIIGLGHRAQQGKDTLAAHLIEKLGPRPEGAFGPYFPIDIRRYAFADELKVEVFDFLQALNFDGISSLYLLPDLKVYTIQEKIDWINIHKGSYEIRRILQRWGTEYRRALDPDYWVKKTLSRIQQEKPQVAFITDMRFLNETVICDVQINVTRPNYNSGVALHKSETELDSYPYPWTVVGESVEDLKRKGFDLVEGLLKEKGIL